MTTKTFRALLAAMLVVCLFAPAAAQQPEAIAKYRALLAQAAQIMRGIGDDPPTQVALNGFTRVLALLEQARALNDTPEIRRHIQTARAMVLWFRGETSANNKDYWAAVQYLTEARKRNPDLMGAEESAFIDTVFQQHLRSLPNNTRIVSLDEPGFTLREAVDRVWWDATPETRAHVVAAFLAAFGSNWSGARQSFQTAASLAPENAPAQRFFALADSAPIRASRGLNVPSGTTRSGGPLPPLFDIASLKANMILMDTPAIMKALEDILLVLYRNAGH